MHTRFLSFDGTESCRGVLRQPDRYSDLRATLAGPGSHSLRGSGLSYCQASAGEGIDVVSSRHFNRFLEFDPEQRRIRVEPGVTVGELVRFAVANDCYFPVLPGHPSITVGGCAGFNVHGKTQHNVGLFSDFVESLSLLHPDHGELSCSRTENAEILDLTVGGMGLTGYISDLTLRLEPLRGGSVRRRAHRVENLREAVVVMESLRDTADALYSWNDLNLRNSEFGGGFVYEERFVADVRPSRTIYRTLNSERRASPGINGSSRAMTKLMNAAYRARELARGDSIRSVEDAAFPINGNEIYFKLFGRRGFREYQLLVPSAVWPEAQREIQTLVTESGVPITLGSLKLFAGAQNLLWFRGDGVCVTIDAADSEETRKLFARLDRFAVESGAIVNVSKDSRLSAKVAEAIFPDYREFRDRLNAFDPERRFDSALRERLDV